MRSLYLFLTFLIMSAIALTPLAGASSDPNVSSDAGSNRWTVDAGLWRASLRGSNFTISNFTADLSGQMNMGDSTSLMLRLNYRMNDRWALHLEYFDHSFNGTASGTVSQTFPYEANNYTHIQVRGNYTLSSSFDLWALDGSATYRLAEGRTGFLDAMLGIRYMSLKLYGSFTGSFTVDFYSGSTLVTSTPGQTYLEASYSVDGPVPYLGLGGELKLSPQMSLRVAYRGMSYNSSSFSASFSDLTAGLHWTLRDRLALTIGYKDQEMDYTDSDGRKGTLSLRGPAFTLRYRF